jgi:hypothetical protein
MTTLPEIPEAWMPLFPGMVVPTDREKAWLFIFSNAKPLNGLTLSDVENPKLLYFLWKTQEEQEFTVNYFFNGLMTPLMLAAVNNIPANVKCLVKMGANINAVNSNGTSALHMACVKGHHQVVRSLLESGADVDLSKKSVVHKAEGQGYGLWPDVKPFGLYEVGFRNVTDEKTALDFAVDGMIRAGTLISDNEVQMVQDLLKYGADPDWSPGQPKGLDVRPEAVGNHLPTPWERMRNWAEHIEATPKVQYNAKFKRMESEPLKYHDRCVMRIRDIIEGDKMTHENVALKNLQWNSTVFKSKRQTRDLKRAMSTFPGKKLELGCFSSWEIFPELCKLLPRHVKSFVACSVPNNIPLADLFKSIDCIAKTFLTECDFFTHVTLSHGISPTTEVFQALHLLPHLKVLNLSFNSFTGFRTAEPLCDFLKVPHWGLLELDLSNCGIGDETLVSLGKSFQTSKGVPNLFLHGNNKITDTGIVEFVPLLQGTRLKHLALSSKYPKRLKPFLELTFLESLCFSSFRIEASETLQFLEQWSFANPLILDLGDCKICPQGWLQVGSLIKRNKLVKFSLKTCPQNNQDWNLLIDAMMTSSLFTCLRLLVPKKFKAFIPDLNLLFSTVWKMVQCNKFYEWRQVSRAKILKNWQVISTHFSFPFQFKETLGKRSILIEYDLFLKNQKKNSINRKKGQGYSARRRYSSSEDDS